MAKKIKDQKIEEVTEALKKEFPGVGIEIEAIDSRSGKGSDASVEEIVAEAKKMIAKALDEKKIEAHPNCKCREAFIETTGAKSLELAIKAFAGIFPLMIEDVISKRAEALGMKGIHSAEKVCDSTNGRGELAKEIAGHPATMLMAGNLTNVVVAMYKHGGNVTPLDTMNVVSGQLGAIIAYALTEMVKPSSPEKLN